MKKKKIIKELLSYCRLLAVSVILALIINSALIANAQITSGSMETTIMTGDRVIGNRLAYDFSKPQRGDIVLFHFPDDEKQIFIKRIIGLPNETVTITDGKVYINNSKVPLSEPYLKVIPTGDYGPFIVPADCYFMMGDNRNISQDSRFWVNHFVKKDKILGKAEFCYFPSIHGIY